MPAAPRPAKLCSVRRTLRAGLFWGGALSAVAVAWLLVANRAPAFERFALLRNATAGGLSLLVMFVPVCRFRRQPAHLFGCTLTSWTVLTAVYALLQIPFPRLGARMGTFHFFMLGAVVVGLISALVWVIRLGLILWGEPAVAVRKRTL